MSEAAVVPVHTAVAGRARFSVAGLKRNEGLRRAVEAGLAGRGIRSVSASTSTGTVLVLFETGRDLVEIARRLSETAERAGGPQAGSPETNQPVWHAMDADKVIGAVRSREQGLSEVEAKGRLAEIGANAIPPIRGRTQLQILLSQCQSTPIALLAVSALLSLATGGLVDAAIILGVIALNSAIGFIAEARAEETIGSLRESRPPISRVLRDRKEREVSAEELVPGDLIELRRDDLVPADARVIRANRLTVNEAVLTGESAPAVKAANALAPPTAPVADRHNMVFRGTVVTGGAGHAVVTATGPDTELGRIQMLLGSEDRPVTRLQHQLDDLGRQLVFGSGLACGLFAAIGLVRGFGSLSLLKSVISLAVAAIPEGLPTLATTTLAVAIQDLRRRGILVRRLSAVEALAGIDVVCFDKTGTLTLNDMSVVRLRWNKTTARLVGEQFHTETGSVADCGHDRELARLFELAVLCNDVELIEAAAGDANGSATELALVRAAMRAGLDVESVRRDHPRRATLERAEDRRYMVTVHDGAADRKLVIIKGDPGEVLALCRWHMDSDAPSLLAPEDRRAIQEENLEMAQQALRVLGIAYRWAGIDDSGTRVGRDFIWAGLIGMADPIRKGAPDLIRAFRRSGIMSIMVTGDQRATAAAIAAELGLANGNREEVVDAGQFDDFLAMPALDRDLPRVFARVAPGQKLQLVKALQNAGKSVAMIGDGVNDTPPLRAADIGIALGRSGVEAARGIADIVLLDDELIPLADAVERGRSVAANIRKAIRYLVATNLSEIIFMLAAAMAGRAHPLSAVQLLWINLLTDVLPALGLALEPASPDLMTRPPVSGEAIITPAEFGTLARDAALIAASAFAGQVSASRLTGSTRTTQTVGFSSLVAAQLLYAFACRPRRGPAPTGQAPPNRYFLGALAAAFGAQSAALFVPGLRGLFGTPLSAAEFAISLGAGAAPLLAIEAFRAGQSVRQSVPGDA